MKKIVIFGHRGVGKTALLARLKDYYGENNSVEPFNRSIQNFFDLDYEISKIKGKSIPEIFAQEGEIPFRAYEKQIFKELCAMLDNFVIAVGGGFPVSEIPDDIHCIWLQRPSDRFGRVFFDRPRLNPELSDVDEFLLRAQSRDKLFEMRADEKYLMPEGLDSQNKNGCQIERQIFLERISFTDCSYLTITPTLSTKEVYLKKVANSGWELRDDLLSADQINTLVVQNPLTHFIISHRQRNSIQTTQQLVVQFRSLPSISILVDWALELGTPLVGRQDVISLHEFKPQENLTEFLKRLESYSSFAEHLKASPVIESWTELEILIDWQAQSPSNRNVLPRSADGRWHWCRLYLKGKQKINFWKDSEGSAADQPGLFQWLVTPSRSFNFAAVLGNPVLLSKTPLEQLDFFSRQNCPVFAITVTESEWHQAFGVLAKMGLVAAAVTSPLKKIAINTQNLVKLAEKVKRSGALNTLSRLKTPEGFSQEWSATNTDLEGFRALAAEAQSLLQQRHPEISLPTVAVWGGGGTLPVIREIYPDAVEYSLRTRQPRNEIANKVSNHILIWAAGPDSPLPPKELQPLLVIDLNYREDSQARIYSKDHQTLYVSGETMFKVQAIHQREFWKESSNEVCHSGLPC